MAPGGRRLLTLSVALALASTGCKADECACSLEVWDNDQCEGFANEGSASEDRDYTDNACISSNDGEDFSFKYRDGCMESDWWDHNTQCTGEPSFRMKSGVCHTVGDSKSARFVCDEWEGPPVWSFLVTTMIYLCCSGSLCGWYLTRRRRNGYYETQYANQNQTILPVAQPQQYVAIGGPVVGQPVVGQPLSGYPPNQTYQQQGGGCAPQGYTTNYGS